MNAVMNFDDRLPVEAVRVLVDRHGLWRVVRSAVAAALRPRQPRQHVDLLSDHLRRDIGLQPLAPGPVTPVRRV